MKKKLFLILFVVFSVLLSAEIDFNLVGAGARAAGMGGAFIGIADDATAVSWNPAGLTQLEKLEISFVGRLTTHSTIYTNQNQSNEYIQNSGGFNFISAAFPISKNNLKFVGSLSLQNQLDFTYEDDTTNESGGANTFNFGLGIRPIPVFSLGFSLNKWLGGYHNTQKDNDFTTNANVSGLNINTGLMFDLNNMNSPLPLKFGISYKKPFVLTIDFDKTPAKYDIYMPMMLGFGSSLRLGDNFTFDIDYEIKAYKNRKIKDNNNNEGVISYYNLNQLRLGAEFLIVTDFAVIPLRAGYFTSPTTQYLENNDGSVGDQIVGNGISLGTGLIFSSFSLDTYLSASGHTVDFGNDRTIDDVKVKSGLSLIIYF